MTSIDTLTNFLGWCSVINIGVLFLSAILVFFMRDTITQIHKKLFKVDEEYLAQGYFQYLAQYKILILILNLIPYVALKIIS